MEKNVRGLYDSQDDRQIRQRLGQQSKGSTHTGDSGRVPSSTSGSALTSAANEHAGRDRDD
eukprot:IDg5125t1